MIMPSTSREVSFRRGATRPLVLSSVLVILIFVLIYILISFPHPLLPSLYTTTSSPIHIKSTVIQVKEEIIEDRIIEEISGQDLYAHINDEFSRKQIPPFNIPYFYHVSLKLYLPWKSSVSFGEKNLTFDGSCRMYFTVHRTNRRLLIHSLEQHIGDVRIEDEFARPISIKEVSRDFKQLLDIRTEVDLMQHMNYTLFINYTGSIDNPQKKGIFTTPYMNNEQEIRYLTVTHLQPASARTLFPCIDNPMFKARFEAVITHPTGTNCLFNTRETNITTYGDWTVSQYERTPIMSTYLFAFALSDYPYKELLTENNVRIRIHCSPIVLNSTSVAADFIPRVLAYYESYFDMKYVLDKLDVFSVPDMKVAAMENWGLITLLSKHLIFDSNVHTITQRRDVTDVLAHEIAHQWFGNLVTMKWWNDLWLNEGFATMIGLKASDKMDNITIRTDMTVARDIGHTLRDDQTYSTKKNVYPVSRGADESFDPEMVFTKITYKKASHILRMVEFIIGEKKYRDGLRHFIKKFQYINADHEDLLSVLAYVYDSSTGSMMAGQNFTLSDVISTWIHQKGFPLLDVVKRESSVVVITQKAYNHNDQPLDTDGLQWKIPLYIRDAITHEKRIHWLVENSTTAVDMGDDVVLDRDGRSYLRIRYSSDLYEEIVETIKTNPDKIPVASRIRLLDDCGTLAEAGKVSYRVLLNMSLYLRDEISHMPLLILNAHLDFIMSRMEAHPRFYLFQNYLIYLFKPLYHRILTQSKEESDVELHEEKFTEVVFTRLCLNGYSPCREYAQQLLKSLRMNCSNIHHLSSKCNHLATYIRSPIYAICIKYGPQEDFDYFYDKWLNEPFEAERERIWGGLVASRRKDDIHKIWREVLLSSSLVEYHVYDLAVLYTRYVSEMNHFVTFVVENIDKIMASIRKLDPRFGLVMQLVQRSMNREEDIHYVKPMVEKVKVRFPPVVAIHKRVESVLYWRSQFSEYFMNNVTLIMDELEKQSDDVILL